MTNIIDLNIKNPNAGDDTEGVEVNLKPYDEAKMVNLIFLRLGGTDVLGLTDKAVDYDIVAFATISLKNPVTVVQSGADISLVPYFQFAKEVVATFSTTRLDAFVAQDKLPLDLINRYLEYTACTPLDRVTVQHPLQ